MKDYLNNVALSKDGKWKHRLLIWGGAIDLCRRKELEIERLLEVKKENARISSAYNQKENLNTISDCFDQEIQNIKNSIKDILEEKHKIDVLIEKLLPEEQKFLYLRFEKGYQYDYIAMRTSISRSTCFRIMAKVIDYLENSGIDES